MQKRLLSVFITAILGSCALTGCQNAPEASADSDVYRAKSALESEVENIASEKSDRNTAEAGETMKERYDALVGTEENGIWICAEIEMVPQTVQTLILRERDDFDEVKLKELLGSENVRNITAEYLEQQEKELNELDEDEKPKEFPHLGDDTFLILSDGQKEASFKWNTCVSYENKDLKQKCSQIYKVAPEIDVTGNGESVSAKFSLDHAEEMLLEKLAALDETDIYPAQIYYYELDDIAFYRMDFSPVYEGIGVANEFGQWRYGEVLPMGTAWVTEEGVASMDLGYNGGYCGKITEQSENRIMTFSQVTEVLSAYLKSGTLLGNSEEKLTEVELVYYPIFQDSELLLTPAWHIFVPLDDMVDALDSGDAIWQKVFEEGAAWNIYLDAVTGELIKVE